MTVIHLARHGQTVWHAENRYAGWSDVALTPVGEQQAERLAAWADTRRLDLIVSSDLSRARITADRAAAGTGTARLVDERWREIDFGDGDGLTASEMESRFPEARAAFVATPATAPLPGGETGAHVVVRVREALTELVDRVGDGEALVVAHTTTLRLLLCSLLGIDLDEYRRALPSLDNVAVTSLRASTAGGLRAGLMRYNVPV